MKNSFRWEVLTLLFLQGETDFHIRSITTCLLVILINEDENHNAQERPWTHSCVTLVIVIVVVVVVVVVLVVV